MVNGPTDRNIYSLTLESFARFLRCSFAEFPGLSFGKRATSSGPSRLVWRSWVLALARVSRLGRLCQLPKHKPLQTPPSGSRPTRFPTALVRVASQFWQTSTLGSRVERVRRPWKTCWTANQRPAQGTSSGGNPTVRASRHVGRGYGDGRCHGRSPRHGNGDADGG